MNDFELIVEPKPWYRSRGVIGGVVAVVSGILGLSVGEAAQIVDLLVAVGSLVGGAYSIYGRLTAKQVVASVL